MNTENTKVVNALNTLKEAMEEDSDFMWAWQCNLAMMAHDAGAPIIEANLKAAGFMKLVFETDVVNTERFKEHIALWNQVSSHTDKPLEVYSAYKTRDDCFNVYLKLPETQMHIQVRFKYNPVLGKYALENRAYTVSLPENFNQLVNNAITDYMSNDATEGEPTRLNLSLLQSKLQHD